MASDEASAGRPWPARTVDALVARALRLRVTRAWLLYAEKHGPMLADGITYRALFSVFAAVLLGFSAAGLWLSGNPQALAALVSAVDAAIPGLVGSNGLVDPTLIRAPVGLSITGVISVIVLVGAALGAIGSLRIALRTLAGRLADDVLWVWVLLRNLALAVGIAVAFALSAGASVVGALGLDFVATMLGVAHSPGLDWPGRVLSALVVFALDTAIIAGLFTVLSGVRARGRTLWGGAVLGGFGLLVLQQLSSLFVGGARSNPLLAAFAALIALLLWLNLSAQVILLASAWIITGVEDGEDRASGHPRSFAERRLDRAERLLTATRAERDAAKADLTKPDPAKPDPAKPDPAMHDKTS
ncbi:YihY/virulence factor BrkB family protein [Microbacterium capsulatum]|uniref:YihY/virulence factor BrkB family protein n=1 Tax=Microbacterium capsulatum TaxID=3041921 RepID=A0ABU0XB50_9MICO|nr:YihY/virulence factor BrkB family protein [Microbacterium sp. ASV81]MDQ4212335.1 YihY/virulence factor BrkB family protein [Microbacterium sp. ASV81]